MLDLIWIQTVWHLDGIEKSNIQRVKYGTIIKCEGIIKQYLKIQKLMKNTLFRKYVTFESPRLYI